MIGKVIRGTRVGGLTRYLFGPGERNEHVAPHVVAGFRHPAALEPGVRSDGSRDVSALNGLLNLPLAVLPPGTGHDKPVWHCVLRAAPEDPVLSGDDWAAIAYEVMDRVGLAKRDDNDAVRWMAVRHANDHVHVVATLARQDGRKARVSNDFYRVREACNHIEQRYGLRATAPADRTAGKRPARAETELSHRQGRTEEPRRTLRRQAATVAAMADGEADFFARLRADGMLVRERFSRHHTHEVTGYAVALPGHANRDGQPVWFGGGRLAADLTLPKLRHRWNGTPLTPERGHVARDTVWRQAADAAAFATRQLHTIDARHPAAAGIAWATADLLRVSAMTLGDRRNGALVRAADAYDRAAREPYGRLPATSTTGMALRGVARVLAGAGRENDRMDRAVATMLNQLARLLEAVACLRVAQHRHVQADAAIAAVRHLRGTIGIPSVAGATAWTDAPKRVDPLPRRAQSPAEIIALDFPGPPVGGVRTASEQPPPPVHAGPLRPHRRHC